MYINDLPDLFEGDCDSPTLDGLPVHCLMYADDLVLLSLTENGLQDKLDLLKSYCDKWSLTINIKKTKVMLMANTKVDHEYLDKPMKIGGETLEWVHVYKYLGIELHYDGNFLQSSENLCIRGWKSIFKIKAAFKDVDVCPKLTLKLFDVLVKPVVCYSSEYYEYPH